MALANALRSARRARELARQRNELATQLERRMGELFSLQELGYVLAESLQVDRLSEQLARYVQRFLRADGALVAVVDDHGRLRVTGAGGSLATLLGREAATAGDSLVARAVSRERIELEGGAGHPVHLLEGVVVQTAAAAPLRAQGVTIGVLAVAGRASGAFTTEDLWILSTAATHAAVVFTNSRLFGLVERGKAEWETAFDALNEGIAVLDRDGRVARANRSLGRILDRGVTALTGQPFAALVSDPPDLATALVPPDGEVRPPLVVRSPGRGRMLRLTAAPFTDPGGGSAVVVLVEDVTDQRALEGQLIQSEKMAAVGQLVSGVAHELNNPLTSIAGLAELLVEQAKVPADVRDHLRVIHTQADRAGRIVQNLLTFARKGAAERTLTDLNDVAARTALLIGYELRLRAITLDERLAAAPVLVQGDRYELQQVVLNLLTNAIQALAAAGRSDPGRVVLETGIEDGRAVLRVTDNGPGVRPEDAGLLFTPFFTTKSPGEGTGLGLSISYGIVEAHGGKLEYAPAPGGGAAFTIALPVAEAPVVAPRRILLVGDDPKDERLVAALFARDGHVVEAVRTAEEGLARLAAGGADLVVADARLTTTRGESFVLAAVQAQPAVRPRLLAAVPRATPASADRLREAGIQVIAYPFDLKALRTAAESVLGQ